MKVGVLALQGCVDQHIQHLRTCSVDAIKVRTKAELDQVDRLILPGGESSSMLTLLKRTGLWTDLASFVQQKPCWGICAGAILLAQEVLNPDQDSLAALPIRAYRNHYGSQIDSFKCKINFCADSKISSPEKPLEVDFIRAPKLECLSNSCKILATNQGLAVAIQFKDILATSFHSELTADSRLHQFFISADFSGAI